VAVEARSRREEAPVGRRTNSDFANWVVLAAAAVVLVAVVAAAVVMNMVGFVESLVTVEIISLLWLGLRKEQTGSEEIGWDESCHQSSVMTTPGFVLW
jgi:hypothetical protein